MAVIQEAYIHGVSTRAVDDLVRAMGLTGTSKSQVSRLCEEIDERVQAFLNRPLEGLIRMNSGPRTEFPTVRGTVGAVNGPSSGSMPPTLSCARAGGPPLSLGPMARQWLALDGRDSGRGGQHRRAARDSGDHRHALGSVRGENDPPDRFLIPLTLLVRVPAIPHATRPAGRAAGDQRRPRGPQGVRRANAPPDRLLILLTPQGSGRRLAALPRAFPAQPSGAGEQDQQAGGQRCGEDRLRRDRPRPGPCPLARGRRQPA